MKRMLASAVAASVLVLAGCQEIRNEQVGYGVGGALGGLLGAQVGRGSGQLASTAADAVIALRAQTGIIASMEDLNGAGPFPDGAVIVKELRAHSSGDYTTGEGVSYANETLKQWFVMVKDTKGRFPDNAIWGNGWGWALFQPGKDGNVATDYEADCLGCHIPAEASDWIYVEAYPTLKR